MLSSYFKFSLKTITCVRLSVYYYSSARQTSQDVWGDLAESCPAEFFSLYDVTRSSLPLEKCFKRQNPGRLSPVPAPHFPEMA